MWKKEVELFLFVKDMILNIENPEDSTKRLLALITELSEVAEQAKFSNI